MRIEYDVFYNNNRPTYIYTCKVNMFGHEYVQLKLKGGIREILINNGSEWVLAPANITAQLHKVVSEMVDEFDKEQLEIHLAEAHSEAQAERAADNWFYGEV